MSERTREKNKYVVALMALLFMMCFFSIKVNAQENNNGIQCGDNVYATLDSDTGTLTISGTGDMWSAQNNYYFGGIRNDIYRVVIKDGVTSIGAYAFAHVDCLSSVTIGSSVKKIEGSAFYDCDGLKRITIPGNVQVIGGNAFSDSGLTTVTLNKGLIKIEEGAFSWTSISSIVIPEGTTTIEERAFEYSRLGSVTIPSSMVIIKAGAFGCVSATIDSNDVILSPSSFGYGTSFKADRGSTTDQLVNDYPNNFSITYKQYESILTYNANGGSVSTGTKKLLSETPYGKLAVPVRSGYTFAGWYTSPTGGWQIKSETIVTTVKDSTVYAHWNKVTVSKASSPVVKNSAKKEMTVSIKAVSGAKGYQIRYATDSSMKGAKTTTTTGTQKVFKNLSEGKRYYVQVRAYKLDSANRKVVGSWSDKAKVSIKITVAKVKKPKVSKSGKSAMTVTYKSVTGAKGYQIRYAKNSSMKGAKTVTLKGTKKKITKLKRGKTYYVQVRAYKLNSKNQKVYGKWSTKAKVSLK